MLATSHFSNEALFMEQRRKYEQQTTRTRHSCETLCYLFLVYFIAMIVIPAMLLANIGVYASLVCILLHVFTITCYPCSCSQCFVGPTLCLLLMPTCLSLSVVCISPTLITLTLLIPLLLSLLLLLFPPFVPLFMSPNSLVCVHQWRIT